MMLRSVILPAYNEEGYIAQMVQETIEACQTHDDPFEIIVVDNASTDATATIVTDIAEADDRVRLVRHPENRLYAGSCQTGASESRGERVFILDSDGQHPPRDIWKIDAALERGFDLVFAWRRHRAEPPLRIVMSRVLLLLTKFYVGFDLHDVNAGIRGMSRAFVDRLKISHKVNMVNPELFVRAKLGGFRIGEVEVAQEPRKAGTSSHELNRLFKTFVVVRRYLSGLRKELR